MTTYFLRRLLLVIPTFLGSTILVFTILQLSPGGPLEKTIQELQTGGGIFGGEGGATSSSISGGTVLPESAMRELKRYYGFDKPGWQRYLIWLGAWPRGIKHRNFTLEPGISHIEKKVGKREGQIWKVDIQLQDDKLSVYEKDGTLSVIISTETYGTRS